MKDKKYFSLPIEFSEDDGSLFDDSLIPVNIKVMHNGINLNNSNFDDQVISDAQNSLKNKPILGYIKKEDGTDNEDFSGHEVEFLISEDGIKTIYLERPLGVVPETNDYSILEEDGKKFVSCKGYLWKEYLNSGYEILKDNPKKSVSMEIVVDDYEINNEGILNILKYRYLGITILGDNVQPAMQGAEMEVIGQFSKSDNTDFYKKLEEINEIINQRFGKVENIVSSETLEKENERSGEVKEEFEKTIELEKAEETEVFEEENTEVTEIQDTPENFTKQFELSHDDIRCKLYSLLYPVEEEDDTWYWIDDVYDTYFIYSGNGKHYKQAYITTDVAVAFSGDRIEVFMSFLTKEELDALEEIKAGYSALQEEIIPLKEFKEQKEKEEFEIKQAEIRQEKVDHINSEYATISEEIRELFISKVDEYTSIEDIDSDVCVYIVKNKVSFSKAKKEKEVIKVDVGAIADIPEVSPYGDLFSK